MLNLRQQQLWRIPTVLFTCTFEGDVAMKKWVR